MSQTIDKNDMIAFNDRFLSTVFERGEIDRLGEFLADDVVTVADGESIEGIDGYTAMLEELRGGFSELDVEVLDCFVDGDSLVSRSRYSGVHSGEFAGVPATDSPVSWESMSVLRMADGKITKIDTIQDRAGLLTQLGVLDERAA